MSTNRDPYGVGADRVNDINDINDDQLRVIRTLLGTLLLIRRPADARRGLCQSEEVRPAPDHDGEGGGTPPAASTATSGAYAPPAHVSRRRPERLLPQVGPLGPGEQ